MTSCRAWATAAALGLALTVAGCGGGGGGDGSGGCGGACEAASPTALTVGEVQQAIAQAVAESAAQGAKATIAVVDRVGNVLAVFRMNGAPATFTITSGSGVSGGLEGLNILPSELAAISKAVTGAYLSSEGNAFSTRTASQIVQQNFNPGEANQPSGPLSGVQFSQLSCSDVNRQASQGTIGPKRAPLGLAADPGGLPLYKNGTLVGAIGVLADGVYTIDLDIFNVDSDVDELIAVAGTYGFAAPVDRRANEITVDGRTLRYVDSEALKSNPANAALRLRVGLTGYVRVQYTGTSIVVDNVTNFGFLTTTIGTFPATLNVGDTLTARSNVNGTVDVWINGGWLGASTAGSTTTGTRIGMQLNSGTVVDDFAGGNTP